MFTRRGDIYYFTRGSWNGVNVDYVDANLFRGANAHEQ